MHACLHDQVSMGLFSSLDSLRVSVNILLGKLQSPDCYERSAAGCAELQWKTGERWRLLDLS